MKYLLNKGVDFDEALDIFYESSERSVTHIVAHNIAFDINVIKSELYRRDTMHYIIEEINKKELYDVQ